MIFLNPLLLFGLSALSIPIIIHFLNLSRYKVIPFANVYLLKKSESNAKRKLKRKNLLLLINRCLLFIFIVLLFAGLTLKMNDQLSAEAKIETIFLDQSPSMEVKLDGESGTKFQKSKEIVKHILNNNQSSDGLTVISNVANSTLIDKRHSKSYAISRIEKLKTSNQQVEILPEKNSYKKVLLLSDFQSNSDIINQVLNDTTRNYSLAPLTNTRNGNLYIDSVFISDYSSLVEGFLMINLKIVWSGSSDLNSFPISITSNQKIVQTSTIDLIAGQMKTLSLKLPLELENSKEYIVSFHDLVNQYDDEFYFTIPPFSTISVVNLAKKTEVFDNLFTNSSLFKYSSFNRNNLNYSLIKENEVFIIDQYVNSNPGLVQLLKEKLENGAMLIFCPGSELVDQDFKQIMNQFNLVSSDLIESTKKELIESQFGSEASNFYSDVFESSKNPIGFPFIKSFSTYTSKKSLIKSRSGISIISIKNQGKGKILFINANLESNPELYKSSIFLPTIYRFCLSKNKVFSDPIYYRVDNEIVFSNSRFASKSQTYILKSPDNEGVLIPTEYESRRFMMSDLFQADASVGFYHLMRNDTLIQSIAVNGTLNESSSGFPSMAELKQKVEGYPHVQVLDSPDLLIKSGMSNSAHDWLNPWILTLIIVFLLIMEVYLLNRFFA